MEDRKNNKDQNSRVAEKSDVRSIDREAGASAPLHKSQYRTMHDHKDSAQANIKSREKDDTALHKLIDGIDDLELEELSKMLFSSEEPLYIEETIEEIQGDLAEISQSGKATSREAKASGDEDIFDVASIEKIEKLSSARAGSKQDGASRIHRRAMHEPHMGHSAEDIAKTSMATASASSRAQGDRTRGGVHGDASSANVARSGVAHRDIQTDNTARGGIAHGIAQSDTTTQSGGAHRDTQTDNTARGGVAHGNTQNNNIAHGGVVQSDIAHRSAKSSPAHGGANDIAAHNGSIGKEQIASSTKSEASSRNESSRSEDSIRGESLKSEASIRSGSSTKSEASTKSESPIKSEDSIRSETSTRSDASIRSEAQQKSRGARRQRQKGAPANTSGLKLFASPHIKTSEKKGSIMLNILIALLPIVIWGIYIFGARALTLLLISILFCNGFEVLSDVILELPVKVKELSPTVTAVIITLMLPVTAPLWLPVFCAFVATVPLNLLYKKTGFYGLDPALTARLASFLLFPNIMTSFSEPRSHISALAFFPEYTPVELTSLATLKAGQLPQSSLTSEFFGMTAGAIGEVSVFLILIGFAYLLITKTISFHVPLIFALTAAIPFYLFPQLPFSSDMLAIKFAGFELISGGFMFCAVFIASGYNLSPKTQTAKLIYGAGCGLLTVLFRFAFKTYDGVGLAIFIMSFFARPLDRLCIPMPFGGYSAKAKSKGSKKKGVA